MVYFLYQFNIWEASEFKLLYIYNKFTLKSWIDIQKLFQIEQKLFLKELNKTVLQNVAVSIFLTQSVALLGILWSYEK